MDPFPSTQQLQNTPAIFHNADGQPLRVFVEASGIVHRPKLVRTLKKTGAEICNDPKQAQVILVDSRSFEGRNFIRDWGSDVNKVVLEHSWVTKSVEAGRALREDDQWGDCLTQDDGLALDPDGNFDDEVDFTNKSPLPTPRVTPVDPSAVPVKAAQKAVSTVAGPLKVTDVVTNQPSAVQTWEESVSAPLSSSAQNHNSQYPALGSQVLSTAQQFAPGFQSTTQPYPPNQPYSPNAVQSLQLMQHLWAQMMAPQTAAAQFNTDPFAISLADAMRNHGIVPYQIPYIHGAPESLPGPSNEAPASGLPENIVETTSSSPTPTPPTPVSRKPKLELKPSANGLPPQVARRSVHRPRSLTPPGPSTSGAPRAKRQRRREKSPENRRKTIASTGISQPLYGAESPTRDPNGNQSHKIFVKDEGEPMTFFVQVDQPSRLSIVTSIKKNGGKISNTQTVADYAVLYAHSKTFTDLLVSTLEARKIAVSNAFVHDCVNANAFLDPEQYKLKLAVSGKSKKRAAVHSSSSDVEELPANEHKIPSQSRGHQEGRKRIKQEREGQSSINRPAVKPEPQDIKVVLERPRVPSPTPPPPHTQQPTSRGYKYPDIEREFALKYMKVLLERDHLMSSNAMAERLFRKLPHHPLGSWRSYIASTVRDDVDKLRRKAAIAYRKAMQQKHPEIVKEEFQDTELNGTAFDVLNNTNAEEGRKEEEESDLDVICNFFAFGGGDEQNAGENEDTLWIRLSNKATCKTANSWIEFYDKHYSVIQERYARVTGIMAQSNDMEADPGLVNP